MVVCVSHGLLPMLPFSSVTVIVFNSSFPSVRRTLHRPRVTTWDNREGDEELTTKEKRGREHHSHTTTVSAHPLIRHYNLGSQSPVTTVV
jgi:hypothetical protein